MYRLTVSLLLCGTALIGACSHHVTSSDQNISSPVPVSVSIAKKVTIPETVTLPGTVTRSLHARLASPYGGLVTSTPVRVGTVVHKGELLLTVGIDAARARLAEAISVEASRRARLHQAAADNARFKALLTEGAVALREYERVHERYVAARARERAAKQVLRSARSDLSYSEVRAPFSGLLIRRAVRIGDYVAPGVSLATVVGGTTEVELQASGPVYSHLQVMASVSVTVAGTRYPARVYELVDAVDPVTRTHHVKLRLGNAATLPFGSYAAVRIPIGSREATVVPADAVVERAGSTGTFVINRADIAEFRLVRTATGADNGMLAIASGIQPGDRVVIAPPLSLGNGSTVHIVGSARVSDAPNG